MWISRSLEKQASDQEEKNTIRRRLRNPQSMKGCVFVCFDFVFVFAFNGVS